MGILSNVKNAFLVLIGKQLISNTSVMQEATKKESSTSVECGFISRTTSSVNNPNAIKPCEGPSAPVNLMQGKHAKYMLHGIDSEVRKELGKQICEHVAPVAPVDPVDPMQEIILQGIDKELIENVGKQIRDSAVPVPEQTTMLQELEGLEALKVKPSNSTKSPQQKRQKRTGYQCRRYTKPQIKSALEMLVLGMHPYVIGECLDIVPHSISNFYRDSVKSRHPDLIGDIERAARAVANNVTYPETKAGQERVVKAAIRIMSRNGALDKDRVSKALAVSKRFITLNSADYEKAGTKDLTNDPIYEDVSA